MKNSQNRAATGADARRTRRLRRRARGTRDARATRRDRRRGRPRGKSGRWQARTWSVWTSPSRSNGVSRSRFSPVKYWSWGESADPEFPEPRLACARGAFSARRPRRCTRPRRRVRGQQRFVRCARS